jgi:hypothetical protein
MFCLPGAAITHHQQQQNNITTASQSDSVSAPKEMVCFLQTLNNRQRVKTPYQCSASAVNIEKCTR